MIPLLIIIALILSASSGLLLYVVPRVSRGALQVLMALGAGVMLAVSLTHILPEMMDISHWSLYGFLGGFVGLYIFEELFSPHRHDHHHHDHTHEDPHEHIDHVARISVIALVIHTLFDGVGIGASWSLNAVLGIEILGSVLLHQIPVSLSLASVLQETSLARKSQILTLIPFILAAPLGFILSEILTTFFAPDIIALATAIAGGTLLYIASVEILPILHAQLSRKSKYLSIVGVLMGIFVMLF